MSDRNDRITCSGCGRKIIPRLWHYGGGTFTYMRTQHQCPFCGIVMYESGGGFRLGCLLPLIIIPLFTGLVFILITLMQLRR